MREICFPTLRTLSRFVSLRKFRKIMKTKTVDSNGITALLERRINNTGISSDDSSFDTSFAAEAFTRLCLDSLRNCRITPDISITVSNLFFASVREETAAVLLINKRMRIKKIDIIARGYKARMSEFTDDIVYLCKKHNCNGCIVILNYSYKGSELKEVHDINKLYVDLLNESITLIDCIKNTYPKMKSVITPYTTKGYVK